MCGIIFILHLDIISQKKLTEFCAKLCPIDFGHDFLGEIVSKQKKDLCANSEENITGEGTTGSRTKNVKLKNQNCFTYF